MVAAKTCSSSAESAPVSCMSRSLWSWPLTLRMVASSSASLSKEMVRLSAFCSLAGGTGAAEPLAAPLSFASGDGVAVSDAADITVLPCEMVGVAWWSKRRPTHITYPGHAYVVHPKQGCGLSP